MHEASGKKARYGEFASAAAKFTAPEELTLKDKSEFSIIGTSRLNVDGKKIVTGQPLFGLDYQPEGTLIAMAIHAPAFGLKLKSFDAEQAKSMPGIKDVFSVDTYPEGIEKRWSDTSAFSELVVVVGNSTWQVMQAKKAVTVEWEGTEAFEKIDDSTSKHKEALVQRSTQPGEVEREDGDADAAFKRVVSKICCGINVVADKNLEFFGFTIAVRARSLGILFHFLKAVFDRFNPLEVLSLFLRFLNDLVWFWFV